MFKLFHPLKGIPLYLLILFAASFILLMLLFMNLSIGSDGVKLNASNNDSLSGCYGYGSYSIFFSKIGLYLDFR